jgi:hypothetical protein
LISVLWTSNRPLDFRGKYFELNGAVCRTGPEPIPSGSPIRNLRNVFLSPHIAGVTAASRPRFFSFMVDELERCFAGRDTLFDITPRTLANRRGLAAIGA